MEMIKKSLKNILNEFNQIIIPDIQRDYVMASGGKKFHDLLNSMANYCNSNEKFNFSCLIGYKDDNNNLYIYDGQQRLVTLIYLCAHLLENTNIEEGRLLRRFSFTNRDVANSWIAHPQSISEEEVVDFTTYSLNKLIKEFDKMTFKIPVSYILNEIIFDLILVDKISDAEQFFLDINDGLDLKPYEVFKAELFNRASMLLDKESFKRIALKMENKWLNFFLAYIHKEKIWKSGEYVETIINCEEEMLIFFVQYCLRMMWIEKTNSEEGYELSNISWLKKEHFIFFEQILDAIIDEIDKNVSEGLTCINYSLQASRYPTKYCKGQHWNISDNNYIDMLKVFLENLYDIAETKKDVVIWCYISKLPFCKQNKKNLYEYLRLIKKILNNNRSICTDAIMNHGGWKPENNQVIYCRNYVQQIPQYYTACKNEYSNNQSILFINKILSLNTQYMLEPITIFLENCISKFNDTPYKDILLKENKKYNCEQYYIIREYEDLPFINGLADCFLRYTEDTCKLNEFCNKDFLAQLSSNNLINNNSTQFKDIIKFLIYNKRNILDTLFSDVKIYWNNYCGTKFDRSVAILPHTFCDLFTSEKRINYNETQDNYPIYLLPDGWISNQNKIIQPQETEIYGQNGFAAYGRTHQVGDLCNFLDNFSDILLDSQSGYIIDGNKVNLLPDYLNRYNDNNWITSQLHTNEKVYYSEDTYLNSILVDMFIKYSSNNMDVNKYLREHSGWMRFQEMFGNKFFISIG